MSLIVGQYYRGDPKQKPKQWGPVSTVQSEVFYKTTKLGIDPAHLVLYNPCWNGGNQYNYGYVPTIGTNTNAQYTNNKLNFNAINSNLNYGSNPGLNNLPALTIITQMTPLGGGENGYGCIYEKSNTDTSGARFRTTDINALHFRADYSSADLRKYTTNSAYTLGSKYTFTLTWDGSPNSNGVAIYIDGTEESYIVDENGSGDRVSDASNDLIIGQRTDGDRTIDADMDYIMVFSSVLTIDQQLFIYENPYYLIQPPTFRTYFDLAETGTTLSFSNINSNSNLNNDILFAIRLLSPNNLNCFTEISDSIISGLVNILRGNDVSNDSQITQASVYAIKKLLGQEISSLSQITDASLNAIKSVGLTDINALSEVTTIVFSVLRQLTKEDISSSTQVTNSSITKGKNLFGNDISSATQILDLSIDIIKKIQANSIESISDITDVVLSITGGISGINLESQTEIISIVLSVLRALKQNNIKSESLVEECTLNIIHQLNIDNINSLSSITDIVLESGAVIGINDDISLSQITNAVIDIIRFISPISIDIQSEINNPVINVIRTLYQNIINVTTNVTSVGVTNLSNLAAGKVTITFSMGIPSISWSLD